MTQESNGGNLVKTYSRVGRAKDLKTSKYLQMVVTHRGPFSLWILILKLSKGLIIRDEENQLHVSQLCVCPFKEASHQMRVTTQSAGQRIWYRNSLSSFQFDLPNFVSSNSPGDKLSPKIPKQMRSTHSIN